MTTSMLRQVLELDPRDAMRGVGGGQRLATIHTVVARAIWPDKTAECWAAAAGKKPDIGKLWLRGRVSGDGKLAIIRLLD